MGIALIVVRSTAIFWLEIHPPQGGVWSVFWTGFLLLSSGLFVENIGRPDAQQVVRWSQWLAGVSTGWLWGAPTVLDHYPFGRGAWLTFGMACVLLGWVRLRQQPRTEWFGGVA